MVVQVALEIQLARVLRCADICDKNWCDKMECLNIYVTVDRFVNVFMSAEL